MNVRDVFAEAVRTVQAPSDIANRVEIRIAPTLGHVYDSIAGRIYPVIPPSLSYTRPLPKGRYLIAVSAEMLDIVSMTEDIPIRDLLFRVFVHELCHIMDMEEGIYTFTPEIDILVLEATYDRASLHFADEVAHLTHIAKDIIVFTRLKKLGLLERVERFKFIETSSDESMFVTKNNYVNVREVMNRSSYLIHVILYAIFKPEPEFLEKRHVRILKPFVDALMVAWRLWRDWRRVSTLASFIGFMIKCIEVAEKPLTTCYALAGIAQHMFPQVSRFICSVCEEISKSFVPEPVVEVADK